MITVLTDPIESRMLRALRHAKRWLFRSRAESFAQTKKKYGGHYGVTRSLVEGLTLVGEEFNFNPVSSDAVGETIVVLGNPAALRSAYRLKQAGRVQWVLAGPTMVLRPSDAPEFMLAAELDRYIVPSEWCVNAFEADTPGYGQRCLVWPAGVDPDVWTPIRPPEPRTLLFYKKRPPPKLYARCVAIAQRHGFKVEEIEPLRYVTPHFWGGGYTIEQYRTALWRCQCVVHFVEVESQGLSLAEAWGADRPTLVWDPGFSSIGGYNYDSMSAPYLTEQTGCTFVTAGDFENLLTDGWASPQRFSPRDWILKNMTDEICARALVRHINRLAQTAP